MVCLPCPIGYTCNGATATIVPNGSFQQTPRSTGLAGTCGDHYCPSTAWNEYYFCPVGFAESGSIQKCSTTVPAGSYRDSNAYPIRVRACSAGYYSIGGDPNDFNCIYCPAGYSCATTSAQPVLCATGKYSTGGWTSCTDCPLSKYCSLTGVLGTCGERWYSPAGKSACYLCPHGSYCTGG